MQLLGKKETEVSHLKAELQRRNEEKKRFEAENAAVSQRTESSPQEYKAPLVYRSEWRCIE